MQREYSKDFQKKVRETKTSDPRAFWKLLNKADSHESNLGGISPESFREHFKNLSFSPALDGNIDNFNPRTICHSSNDLINEPFSVAEISGIVKKLKSNKACGIDHIINEFLKYCPQPMLCIIVKFFNIVLNTGIVPYDWCVGIIINYKLGIKIDCFLIFEKGKMDKKGQVFFFFLV